MRTSKTTVASPSHIKVRLSAWLLPTLVFAAPRLAAAGSDSWPTLHGNLQRQGFYARFPQPPFTLVWRKELHRELTGPRAEVIVGGGLAFMGTYAGRLYAWDADTGVERWVFQTGGPIGHSPAWAEGTLYVGSMDRCLYALDATTGRMKWRFEAAEGIWTSPALSGGRVLFGARDGVFYALDAATGRLAWRFQTGDRILTTAAVSDDGTRVVFASEDMHVYCLAVRDGALLWKSRKLQGLTVRDYFPVLTRGLVLITTTPVKDFHTTLGQHQEMLVRRTGFTGKDPRYIPGTKDDVRREQDFIVDFLKAHPEEQTFYAFRLTDGTEPWIAPILYTGGLHNPLTPPCFNPLTGEVFTQVRSAYGTWDGGREVRPFTGFGKLDLDTGRVELLEHGYPSKEPGRPPGAKDMPWMTFNYIGDETQSLSCAPDLLLCTHQGFIGALDLKTRLTARLYGKRDTYGGFYGPGNFGWENQGGYEKARAVGQPFGLVNEWHGPARAIVSVAGNKVFFPVGSQVLCLEGKPLTNAPPQTRREAASTENRRSFVPTAQYEKRALEGWTVFVNKSLLNEQAVLGSNALRLLETKLAEIRRVVPARAVAALQQVPIWLGVNDGHAPCAEYHPSRDWLAEHGYNPDKARCVEIGNAARFVEWSKTQPAMVLHELAHAYHHQVLGHDHAVIKAAYSNAVASHRYDAVKRANGKTARAYALNNDQEFFAETTEALFGTNDFFPFTRAELKDHDPEWFKTLEQLWHRAP